MLLICHAEMRKRAFAHDLLFAAFRLEPDVEAQADDVDVRAGAPGSAGVFAVGIAEGDVDAGKFLILQDVADDAGDADVGADGELADAVGVFVGVGVGPEVLLELLVGAGAGDDAVLRNLEWSAALRRADRSAHTASRRRPRRQQRCR